MTEYELADLAISRQLEINEVASNFQAIIDARGALTQQFMTVLFAYLAAAHFIGASLNRKQVWIFSTLYFLWQSWTILVFLTRDFAARVTLQRLLELNESSSEVLALTEFMPKMIAIAQPTLMLVALAVSLYFMWDERSSKRE
jgi:hypothetical protein